MTTVLDELIKQWEERLKCDFPQMTLSKRCSIIDWLLGESPHQINELNSQSLYFHKRGMDFRYSVLTKAYLDVSPKIAYQRLMIRLSCQKILTTKIKSWIELSSDRQVKVTEVLEDLIMDMLKTDNYLQAQLNLISQCTPDQNLRNSLTLATLDEYCCRSIGNQTLITCRFVNFMQSQNNGGITNVPKQQFIHKISEEISNDGDSPIHLADHQTLEIYQDQQKWQEVQAMRVQVKEELKNHLRAKIGSQAADWLDLYLDGLSQQDIAKKLNLSTEKAYQLREKIAYHALYVFAIKTRSTLVEQWLEISLTEHNLGLSSSQWQTYQKKLNHVQSQLLQRLKDGLSRQEICRELNLSETKLLKHWGELYLIAQEIRNHKQANG